MKAHKHTKDLAFALLMMGMLGLLLIPSCMQAQSKEGTTISKGDQHDS